MTNLRRGNASVISLVIASVGFSPALSLAETIVVGLGAAPSNTGWVEVIKPEEPHQHAGWMRIPWSDYNTGTGETRPVACDVDGDGKDEVIIGLGSYPDSGGWLEVKDDASTDYTHLAWVRVAWRDYNDANGETFPACGDLDGDGKDELAIGLGSYPTNGGWVEIKDDADTDFAHLTWVRVNWRDYNDANGAVLPAIGNLDADPAAELALGLGSYPGQGGWVQMFDDATMGFAPLAGTPTSGGWVRLQWSSYHSSNGETRPTVCDLNGDGRGELALGLADGGQGWVQLLDSANGFDPLAGTPAANGWVQVGWSAYVAGGKGVFPACGDLDGDGVDELVLGLDSHAGNGGWIEVKADLASGLAHRSWARVHWAAYNSADGLTRPTVMHHPEKVNVNKPSFLLTVGVIGNGNGVVTGSDISCGTVQSSCTKEFLEDTSVTLTASPQSGSVFHSWTGCDSTIGSTCTVSMTSDRAVTARFERTIPLGTITISLPSVDTDGNYTLSWACSGLCSTSYRIEEDSNTSFANPALYFLNNAAPPYAYHFTGKANGTYCYRVGSQGVGTSQPACITVTMPEVTVTTVFASADNVVAFSTTDASLQRTVFNRADLAVGCNFDYGIFTGVTDFVCYHTLLTFNIQALIQGKAIDRAILRIFPRILPADLNDTYAANAIFDQWNPATVTWDNQPKYFTSPQIQEQPPVTGAVPLEFDVTAIVQAWAANSRPNNGIRLGQLNPNLPNESVLRATFFESMDVFTNGNRRPQLYLEYR